MAATKKKTKGKATKERAAKGGGAAVKGKQVFRKKVKTKKKNPRTWEVVYILVDGPPVKTRTKRKKEVLLDRTLARKGSKKRNSKSK